MFEPETFYRNLEATLEIGANTIKGDESLGDLPWDSLSVVVFIAMADEKYSAVIAPAKLAEAKSVAALMALVAPVA